MEMRLNAAFFDSIDPEQSPSRAAFRVAQVPARSSLRDQYALSHRVSRRPPAFPALSALGEGFIQCVWRSPTAANIDEAAAAAKGLIRALKWL